MTNSNELDIPSYYFIVTGTDWLAMSTEMHWLPLLNHFHFQQNENDIWIGDINTHQQHTAADLSALWPHCSVTSMNWNQIIEANNLHDWWWNDHPQIENDADLQDHFQNLQIHDTSPVESEAEAIQETATELDSISDSSDYDEATYYGWIESKESMHWE